MIVELKEQHWNEVLSIYKQGIDLGIATFNRIPPTYTQWDSAHIKDCRYVYIIEGKVVGWVSLSRISIKEAYNGAAELSIYVHKDYKGKRIGTNLMNHLIVESEKNGFWTLESKIIKDNKSSIVLHKSCGFREVGFREKIAKDKDGIWRDVVIMERRNGIF